MEKIKDLIKEWDNVAYHDVLGSLEKGDAEKAEYAVADLVEIDAQIMRAVCKAEEAMGED